MSDLDLGLPAIPNRQALSPKANQPKHDLIETPAIWARLVVRHFRPYGPMLDPCRGLTSHPFYDAMESYGSGQVDWCEIRSGCDFFGVSGYYQWIITNPPWSQMRKFLRHAMRVADNVVFLVTITHLDTRARDREIHEAGFGRREALLLPQPPPPWPSSGFLLAAYHLQRGYTGSLNFERKYLNEGVPAGEKLDFA